MTPSADSRNAHHTELTFDEILQLLVWGFCAAAVWIPLLYLGNGPAVSTDQFVMRVSMCAVVYLGAPLLVRWRQLRRRREVINSIDKLITIESTSGRYVACLAALVVIHVSVVGYQAYCNAPNLNETAHLPAGISHWRFGNFTLYRVNPPLIRMWAALPVLISEPEEDWERFTKDSTARPEFAIGRRFHEINDEATFRHFTLARWTLLPVTLIGLLACAEWARELYGARSGLFAAAMWCFCPNLITWAASITPDCGAAAFGVLAAWRFWKWLRLPSWSNVFLAGGALGLAELTKSTWVVLFGLWPLIWILDRTSARLHEKDMRGDLPVFHQLIVILGMGLYVLNVGYGFENTGQRLGDFTFISRTLGGADAHEEPGNRFDGNWLSHVPVPVPANYLVGIDVQKHDFEVGKWSYLRGEHKKGGWWYYYLYAIVLKTPVGFLAMIVAAKLMWFLRGFSIVDLIATAPLSLPAVVLIVLISSETGFNRYLRYVLPVFPFLYIMATANLRNTTPKCFLLRYSAVCVAIGATGSMWIVPFSHSYFNTVAGGPNAGEMHLLDANIDWGQDLLRLREWIAKNSAARPVYMAVTTSVPVTLRGDGILKMNIPNDAKVGSLSPGWYAIGVNELNGYRDFRSQPQLRQLLEHRNRAPVLQVGYSIRIFHTGRE